MVHFHWYNKKCHLALSTKTFWLRLQDTFKDTYFFSQNKGLKKHDIAE